MKEYIKGSKSIHIQKEDQGHVKVTLTSPTQCSVLYLPFNDYQDKVNNLRVTFLGDNSKKY